MSGAAEGKEQVNAQVPEHLVAYIDARASRLQWKRAKFVAEIINWWEKQGCPPVAEADGLFPRLPYQKPGATPPPKKKWRTEGPHIGSEDTAKQHHETRH